MATAGSGIQPADQFSHRQVRPTPSPAFNAETKDRSHVQPLVNAKRKDMDESYVDHPLSYHCQALTAISGSLGRLEEKSSTR